jgi:hypothetical protein
MKICRYVSRDETFGRFVPSGTITRTPYEKIALLKAAEFATQIFFSRAVTLIWHLWHATCRYHFLVASVTSGQFRSDGLPKRNGVRPKTIVGPLHFQYSGHGDPRYLNQLVKDVLMWPHIDVKSLPDESANLVCLRLEEAAASNEASAFLSPREFGRVHLSSPTIVLALPLIWAHWAIVRGWAEPHYLRSFGMMPAGAVVVYTPTNPEELAICYLLFSKSYHFASRPVPDIT